MRHEMSIVMAVMRPVNETVFQKTLAFSDFYFGSDDWDYPLGLIQMCATSHADQIKGEELPGWLEFLPDMPFSEIARHSMDFWLQAEDLPRTENRVYYKDGKVHLDVAPTNPEALARLKRKLEKSYRRSAGPPCCSNARSISARTSRFPAQRTRRAPVASAQIRRRRC